MSASQRVDGSSRPHPVTGQPDPADLRNQAALFCVLWAVGTIAHVLRKTNPTEPFVWLLMIACVLLIETPTSRWRLGAVAAAYLAYFWTNVPLIGNHAHMMAFANLGILATLLWNGIRGGRGSAEGTWLPTGYLRLTVLLSYGASALAKLNTGFFEIETSCAVGMFYKALAAGGVQPGSFPPAVEWLLPYVIAGVELLIPVLLFVPRFSRTGIVVVVIFHLLMSLSPTATAIDFTLVLLAFVSLFFPATTATAVVGTAAGFWSVLPEALRAGRAALFILAAFVLAMCLWSGKATVFDNRNWLILAAAVLTLFPLFLWAAWATPSFRSDPGAGSGGRLPRNLLGIVLGLLVTLQLANISAPYLGSKNLGTFTMYSNLRTEGGTSNHFLIPRLPVRMGQDDLVEIVDSSSGWLRGIRDAGQLISWHELRRILSMLPDESITYIRDGVRVELARASEDPELVTRDPIAHKFIGHRLYDPRRDTCRH